jgi:hypothetical protein
VHQEFAIRRLTTNKRKNTNSTNRRYFLPRGSTVRAPGIRSSTTNENVRVLLKSVEIMKMMLIKKIRKIRKNLCVEGTEKKRKLKGYILPRQSARLPCLHLKEKFEEHSSV